MDSKDTKPSFEIEISFIDWIVAAIKQDHEVLSQGKSNQSTLMYGIVLVLITIFLDFMGIRGFNFRLTFEVNNTLSPFYIIIQPLFLMFLAYIISILSGSFGEEIEFKESMILLGTSHIWTLLSILFFPLLYLTPTAALLFFFIFGTLYSTPIISGISNHEFIPRLGRAFILSLILLIISLVLGLFIGLLLI